MAKQDKAQPRIQAAIARLEELVNKPIEEPVQGSLIMGEDPVIKAEIDSLRIENQLLRQELLELTAAYNGLKQATDNVSGRLDTTIEEISTLLEQ